MVQPARLTCPTCLKTFRQDRTDAMPFCSKACQKIDLAHWLNEEIGMPMDPAEGDRVDGLERESHDSTGLDEV